MDGGRLLVVLGDGKWIVPGDLAVRRPNPPGPGRRGRTTRGWAQVMRDEPLAAWRRRGLDLPAPLVVAERWGSDAKLLAHVADTPHGTCVVPGKAPSTSSLDDGRKIKGADLVDEDNAGPLRPSLNAPAWRSARRRATSPTEGEGTLIIVAKPGEKRCALRCVATPRQATRWRRRWARRHGSAPVFRPLKHLLATDACQVPSAQAYDGHLG